MNTRTFDTVIDYPADSILPSGGQEGLWAGRVWIPASHTPSGIAGPRVVAIRDGRLFLAPYRTFADLLNDPHCVSKVSQLSHELAPIAEVIANSRFDRRATRLQDEKNIVLLAPNDLPATKACGVTFIRSLLERVIEEKAKGDPLKAGELRELILETLGDDLSKVTPGTPETEALKEKLIKAGVWSQYLEVGIGKDAEVFTKAQPMSSVGYGAQIGVLPDSAWNNSEPEIVLAVSADGTIRGATLGNDVNLRDYEGRSALLLGEAKDQNASCAIGPLVRLFDSDFSLTDVKNLEVELSVAGEDGFVTTGSNRMCEISRAPESLVAQACGKHHQYPDGFMLFLGTMFAPTEDRDEPGAGFTHHVGDRVEISAGPLGRLVNWVNHTHAIPAWEYGSRHLMQFLIETSQPQAEG